LIDGTVPQPDEPLGKHPDTGELIFVLTGRYGPYVQLGETPPTKDENGKTIPVKKRGPKPRRASLPQGMEAEEVTLEDAVKFLLLPRELGDHPKTGEPIIANSGQYGPYIGHAGDFRSLQKGDTKDDDPYTITYERALEILKQPKTLRKGEKLCKELGVNPATRKLLNIYESKSGRYMRKGFKRINIPDDIKTEDITMELAVNLLKQG